MLAADRYSSGARGREVRMEVLSAVLVLAAIAFIVFAVVRKLAKWAFIGVLLIVGAGVVFVLR